MHDNQDLPSVIVLRKMSALIKDAVGVARGYMRIDTLWLLFV